MPSRIPAAPTRHFRLIRKHSSSKFLPQRQLLLLAWCALVVVYGEKGMGPLP